MHASTVYKTLKSQPNEEIDREEYDMEYENDSDGDGYLTSRK